VSPARKTLALFGRRGDQVRALVDARRNRVEVKYREIDRTKASKTFPTRRKAAPRRSRGPRRTTRSARRWRPSRRRRRSAIRSPSEISGSATSRVPAYTKDLREKSQINYRGRWKKWEAFIKPDYLVDDTTLHDVDRFRVCVRDSPASCSTACGNAMNVVRTVYNWGSRASS
jgi:hypothetical protein